MPRSTAYRAICLGSDSLNHLFYGGELISVFPHTINVRAGDGELVVITSKSVRSPIHINVEPDAPFSFRAMSRVDFDGNMIKLEGGVVELLDYEVFESRLKPPSGRGLEAFRGLAERFALLIALTGAQAAEPDPIGRKIVEFGLRLAEGEFEPDLILGLGPGFTPSGDDVLSGYLACRNHLASTGLAETVRVSPSGKTTWVSGKLIEYYQSLKVDSTMEEALNAISAGRPDLLADAMIELAPRGHTSGPDMAFGLALALYEALEELEAFLKPFV